MKVIRINVFERSISLIDINEKESLKAMQEIVGGFIETALNLQDKNVLFVNDSGLLNDPKMFQIWGWENQKYRAFAGNGVIVRYDEEGESVDTTITVDMVEKSMEFADLNTVQMKVKLGLIV